jgi:hypothetical protein
MIPDRITIVRNRDGYAETLTLIPRDREIDEMLRVLADFVENRGGKVLLDLNEVVRRIAPDEAIAADLADPLTPLTVALAAAADRGNERAAVALNVIAAALNYPPIREIASLPLLEEGDEP